MKFAECYFPEPLFKIEVMHLYCLSDGYHCEKDKYVDTQIVVALKVLREQHSHVRKSVRVG